MKQKDLALILVVAIVSALAAIILSRFTISTPENRSLKAETVQPITADFPEPDKRYFNDNSIDPTQTIRIGDGSNTQPFNP